MTFFKTSIGIHLKQNEFANKCNATFLENSVNGIAVT